jgi:hypothetical protein
MIIFQILFYFNSNEKIYIIFVEYERDINRLLEIIQRIIKT